MILKTYQKNMPNMFHTGHRGVCDGYVIQQDGLKTAKHRVWGFFTGMQGNSGFIFYMTLM
jgi:hypothetical protein